MSRPTDKDVENLIDELKHMDSPFSNDYRVHEYWSEVGEDTEDDAEDERDLVIESDFRLIMDALEKLSDRVHQLENPEKDECVQCPKCGNKALEFKYHDCIRRRCFDWQHKTSNEHLHFDCKCGYDWTGKPLDAK